jgi:hypothetical protein
MKAARCQLDPSLVKENSKPDQSGQVFNIWYSKWTGGETNGRTGLVHAKHRCDVKRDSGYTGADKYIKEGQINRTHYFCLYFARGYCCNGKNCEYLHRIPTDFDIFSPTVDCFGREKFMDYRDDMSGIGSFKKVNKTLYINRIADISGNIELKISKCFSDFGDISYIKVLFDKNAAFVSYKLESQAQFAKEAMYGQSLIIGNISETLNVRWANEDPKYSSRKRNRDEQNELSMESARKLLQMLKEDSASRIQKEVKKVNVVDDVKDLHSNEEIELQTVKVGLNFDILKQLQQKRTSSSTNQLSTKLVNGYSSSEDED